MISTARVRRGIELGLVVLVALMPFHAFLSVWLGSITGHEAAIQIWKEVLLALLAAGGVYLAVREPELRDRLRTWPVLGAGLFAIIAVIVTVTTRPTVTAVAFGAKTDLEYLTAFVLAVLVASPGLVRRLGVAILAGAAIVVAFSLAQTYLLPPSFLTAFGYGPHTIEPFLTINPGVTSLRFASTLGGPNQLGSYLILPLTLCLILIIRRRQWWWLVLMLGGFSALLHTYSRAAWLGALAALTLALILSLPPRLRAWATAVFATIALIVAILVQRTVRAGSQLQYFILHSSLAAHGVAGSDFEHLASLRTGLSDVLRGPFGHGLGTAGPATFHAGQTLVIENYYLQIAYETGLAGAIVYILILISTARELALRSARYDLAAASLAALIGICVTALVLPAWVDSSTALIFWSAAGSIIGLTPESRHV